MHVQSVSLQRSTTPPNNGPLDSLVTPLFLWSSAWPMTYAHLSPAHTLRWNTMLRPTYHFSTFWLLRSQLKNYSATFIPGGSINSVFLVPSYCLLSSCVCLSSDVSFLNAFICYQNAHHQCLILFYKLKVNLPGKIILSL
jgi:hypothetical protein